MKVFTCTTQIQLRDFADSVCPQAGFAFARLLRDKDVRVNGVKTGKNLMLNDGDNVAFYMTEREEAAPSHTVVFEDENICITDKFSGVTCEGLMSELNTYGVFYPVHRLDRNTFGLVVFAKNHGAEAALLSAFSGRGIVKKYLAVCKDNFKSPSATVTSYLKKDEKNSLVTIYDRPQKGAKTAITEYRLLKRVGGLALAEVILHTGRTHQIRAQFAHMGCPVLGDGKYGDGALNKKYNFARQRLVAKRLEFVSLLPPLGYLNGRFFESGQSLDLPD